VGRFAARRFLRIFPSFWIAIPVLLAFLTLLTRLHLPLPGSMPQHGVSMTKIVEQVFLLDVNPVWLNGSYWTLPLEVRWYFFCPLLLWLWVRSPKAFAAAGLALLGAHFTTRFANVDLLGLPAFMLGIVAADLQIRRPAIARFALAAFCVLVPIALIKSSVVEVPRPDPLWALLMFSFVVAVGQTPALGRALSLRVFAPIAGASYSIYLIHSPIVAFADHYLPYRLGVAGSLLLDVCIGVSCGIAFSYIAERPFRSGALRQRILKVLDKHIPALLRRMGMEPAIVLKRSTPLTAPFAEATGQPAVA
jgi:peptidoglycan/LPS O-acetylase OafA/YrhL